MVMGSATDLGWCRVKVLTGGFVLCDFCPVQGVLHNFVGKALGLYTEGHGSDPCHGQVLFTVAKEWEVRGTALSRQKVGKLLVRNGLILVIIPRNTIRTLG